MAAALGEGAGAAGWPVMQVVLGRVSKGSYSSMIQLAVIQLAVIQLAVIQLAVIQSAVVQSGVGSVSSPGNGSVNLTAAGRESGYPALNVRPRKVPLAARNTTAVESRSTTSRHQSPGHGSHPIARISTT